MMIFEHVLEGCAPVPLAGYLKALGVFRLVAEQKDSDARGFWRNERFVLKTRLSRDELFNFFLIEFSPTPVVSPWNAGSGFYFQEGKTRQKDPITGKRLKTGIRDQATEATRALDGMLSAEASRFRAYRESIQAAKERLKTNNLDAAPSDAQKAALIRLLRSDMPDATVPWIDAAATVTQFEVVFPPLLGSGGNDGNLDFSTTIIKALVSIIETGSGGPLDSARALLAASLSSETTQVTAGTAISQFTPSAIGAPNSSVGFTGSSSGNAWDIVLGLEGALVMATALARRMGADSEGAASFPFMMTRRGVIGAGAGNIAPADENARGEFWAPLWRRPAALSELASLFREGRVVVDRTTANNALDFAQALSRLGVDRGVDHFERYAFEQRHGNMYLGVPLGRRRVERNPNADLIADIAASGWLARARGAVRSRSAPASMLAMGRRLDESLFRLAEDESKRAVQEVLIALGALVCAAGQRPKLRESLPPPRLSPEWAQAADDGTREFALAAALASLDAATSDGAFRLPFRRHLAPLGWPKGREAWDDRTEAEALVVWTGRSLVRDMASVLERRLVEAQRRIFVRRSDHERSLEAELPLRGRRVASLAAIAAFLNDPAMDDRVAALAAGLAWAGATSSGSAQKDRGDILPLAFAALKPLLDPKGVATPRPPRKGIRRYGRDDDRKRTAVDPLPLLRLLRAGRLDDALVAGLRLGHAANLDVSLVENLVKDRQRHSLGTATRLVAALLMPISDSDTEALAWRAYANSTQDGEENHAA